MFEPLKFCYVFLQQNVILSKIEEITSLQSKLNVLKNEHEALESTAAMLRKELEIRDSIVVSLEKKLGNADVCIMAWLFKTLLA